MLKVEYIRSCCSCVDIMCDKMIRRFVCTHSKSYSAALNSNAFLSGTSHTHTHTHKHNKTCCATGLGLSRRDRYLPFRDVSRRTLGARGKKRDKRLQIVSYYMHTRTHSHNPLSFNYFKRYTGALGSLING